MIIVSFLKVVYPLKYPNNACLSFLDNGKECNLFRVLFGDLWAFAFYPHAYSVDKYVSSSVGYKHDAIAAVSVSMYTMHISIAAIASSAARQNNLGES